MKLSSQSSLISPPWRNFTILLEVHHGEVVLFSSTVWVWQFVTQMNAWKPPQFLRICCKSANY